MKLKINKFSNFTQTHKLWFLLGRASKSAVKKIVLYDATGKKVNGLIVLNNKKLLFVDAKYLGPGMYLVHY